MCKRLLIYIVAMEVSVMSSLGTTLDQAKEMYQAGDYVSALPVFQEYLKKKPKETTKSLWAFLFIAEKSNKPYKLHSR